MTVADQKANLLGCVWMVASMAAFAVEDALIKAASASLPISQVIIMFGLLGTAVFALIVHAKGEALFQAAVLSRAMRYRAVFEIIGRLFYFLAIVLAPLSICTVILQATPIVVVAGAALFFGERVGWHRWLAIMIGLLGVLVVVQPGATDVTAWSILAVVGVLGFAGRDLASRAAPATLSTALLGFYGFVSLMIAGGLYAIWERSGPVMPSAEAWLLIVAATAAGVLAYLGLMKAMRTGEVSAVTPFRYTRLIFGVALGVLWFGEKLTASMIFGCLLLVSSGLFILWRGKNSAEAE